MESLIRHRALVTKFNPTSGKNICESFLSLHMHFFRNRNQLVLIFTVNFMIALR